MPSERLGFGRMCDSKTSFFFCQCMTVPFRASSAAVNELATGLMALDEEESRSVFDTYRIEDLRAKHADLQRRVAERLEKLSDPTDGLLKREQDKEELRVDFGKQANEIKSTFNS